MTTPTKPTPAMTAEEFLIDKYELVKMEIFNQTEMDYKDTAILMEEYASIKVAESTAELRKENEELRERLSKSKSLLGDVAVDNFFSQLLRSTRDEITNFINIPTT